MKLYHVPDIDCHTRPIPGIFVHNDFKQMALPPYPTAPYPVEITTTHLKWLKTVLYGIPNFTAFIS